MKNVVILAVLIALLTSACGSWRSSSINKRDNYSLTRDSVNVQYSILRYNYSDSLSRFNFSNFKKIHEVANKKLTPDNDGFLSVVLGNITHQTVDVNIYVNLTGFTVEEVDTLGGFNIDEKFRVYATLLQPQKFEFIKLPAGNYLGSFKYRDRMGKQKIRVQPFRVDGIEKSIDGLKANGRCFIKQDGVEYLKF